MPLTDTAIRNVKPGEKPVKLFDGGGLYLLVQPNKSRLWRLKYRFEGKHKGISLGVYPAVGLKDARARRDEARKQLAAGVDPSAARKAARSRGVAKTAWRPSRGNGTRSTPRAGRQGMPARSSGVSSGTSSRGWASAPSKRSQRLSSWRSFAASSPEAQLRQHTGHIRTAGGLREGWRPRRPRGNATTPRPGSWG
jgi:hypothetical protein